MSRYRPVTGGDGLNRVSITFTDEQFAFLKKHAREYNISFNETVRQFVTLGKRVVFLKEPN